jgi:hypothetical protein
MEDVVGSVPVGGDGGPHPKFAADAITTNANIESNWHDGLRKL